MAYRKRTLRRLPPTARRIAHDYGLLQGIALRLKRAVEDVAELEREVVARRHRDGDQGLVGEAPDDRCLSETCSHHGIAHLIGECGG